MILIRWVDDLLLWEAVDEESGRCLRCFESCAEAEAWVIEEQVRREDLAA